MSSHLSSPPPGLSGLVQRLGAIGDRPEDDERTRMQHRLLVFMGVLMSCGGLMWGSIAAYFGLVLAAAIPWGYAALTAVNLTYFRFSRDFPTVRFIQVLISLLLPFLFQVSLGGFTASGAVMLWAMLALVGSLTFSGTRQSARWLLAYLAFTVATGTIDAYARANFGMSPPEEIRTLFFVTNIVVISAIVFGLTIYLLAEREAANEALATANDRITQLNEHLEDEVRARTEDLEAALGQTTAILDNMADGLIAVSKTGIIQAANPALGRLLPLPTELWGRDAHDVLPPALAEAGAAACDGDQVVRIEMPLQDGRVAAAVASPIHRGEGDAQACVGAVLLVRDVTLEREIDRMKTDFIATVSHELRTPLTSVLGFAKLIRGRLDKGVFPHVPDDDAKGQRAVRQVRDNVDIIVSEGERLTHLINDVLDISKMEAGRMEWRMAHVDPAEVVQRALDACAGLFEDKPTTLDRTLEPDLVAVHGDADRLLQVVINLVSNAAKFTDEGSVKVVTRNVTGGIEFSVTDTGIGIPLAAQETIFEKFSQVGDAMTDRPTGTGLGLPICREIVRAHHGRITVESAPGSGATFTVFLPAEAAHASRRDADALLDRVLPRRGTTEATRGRDILLVDDDLHVEALFREELEERGFRLRFARTGQQALQLARAKRPDAVILDVMLPDVGGFDVAAILKRDPATGSVPITMMSVLEDTGRAAQLGLQGHLTKPTSPDALANHLERILSETHGAHRILLVDAQGRLDLAAALRARGDNVIAICTPDDAVRQVAVHGPDLLLVDAAESIADGLRTALHHDHPTLAVLTVPEDDDGEG